MLTKHVKIKQLDIRNGKTSSNNDIILMDQNITIRYENHHINIPTTHNNIDYLCQGFFSDITGYFDSINIVKEKKVLTVTINTEKKPGNLNHIPIADVPLNLNKIINFNKEFKRQQTLYHQTGATESVGIILKDYSILAIECLSITSCIYKLLGNLIKQKLTYIPIILISHKPSLDTIELMQKLAPKVIISQSAITSSVLDYITSKKITCFGFCRKNKYNLYTNFHL